MRLYNWRKFKSWFFLGLLSLSGLVLFAPLLFIFFYLLNNGIRALSLDFFVHLPRPAGEGGGGMAHALLGTLYMVGMAAVVAIPWGLAVGVYLSEFGKTKLASIIRFSTDLLNGTPSIVFGIFVYALLVKPFKGFSALAGAVALALVILPVIIRSTEEILKLVPRTLRHAGLALGIPRHKVIWRILVWESRRYLLTGILLALARASGETAPLIFTAFGNMYFSFSPTKPMASLPVEIYNYALSPYPEWHDLAWTGALVLIVMVFALNLGARFLINLKTISILARGGKRDASKSE